MQAEDLPDELKEVRINRDQFQAAQAVVRKCHRINFPLRFWQNTNHEIDEKAVRRLVCGVCKRDIPEVCFAPSLLCVTSPRFVLPHFCCVFRRSRAAVCACSCWYLSHPDCCTWLLAVSPPRVASVPSRTHALLLVLAKWQLLETRTTLDLSLIHI